VRRLQETWPQQGVGRVLLPIGYFANVIAMTDDVGLALCTDGVGSKTIIADRMRKYDTIGIDCVAMNVNDMICVGAKPLSLVDYIAIEHADAATLSIGLCDGARMANIPISGGEIAQLKDIVKGFDLVGMASASKNVRDLQFCYIVDPAGADQTIAIPSKHARHAQRIGHAVADREKTVRLPQRDLWELTRHSPSPSAPRKGPVSS
jgi:hydrogenase maturation factor